MAIIPIQMIHGENLGKRHKRLNTLVNEAFANNIPFESLKGIQESSPVDRLFKIDLAAKYRNEDYIFEMLKDDDLLYVSRALKCNWLVQDSKYSSIINPIYLENELFPEMLTTSVNKMKHWISLNLKDQIRCQEFYQFYKEKDERFALKLLSKCSPDFFLKEMATIPIQKITPHFLKLLCEHWPKTAEIHLKKVIETMTNTKRGYRQSTNTNGFLNCLQFLLKTDPDTYFYLIENIYDQKFKRLNKDATKYIMRNHRGRFDSKPELYTARLLNTTALAKFLNNEEIKELVIKCARAEYLGYDWFSYKFAKPLVKFMKQAEKSSFCKQIFNEKSFGESITEPPYYIPSMPQSREPTEDLGSDVSERNYDQYNLLYGKLYRTEYCTMSKRCGIRLRTLLDQLFNQYRFCYFDETFAELSSRIPRESVLENRQYMLLVLVSKTGGRKEHLEKLLHLLVTKHSNEPVSLRAAIVRSLAKRACVWRLESSNWDILLKFGHDLGLDGNPPSIICREGLHAAVLHHILQSQSCPLPVLLSFLKEFSSLNEYTLNKEEKVLVLKCLPKLLLNVVETETDKATECLNHILDFLTAFRFPIRDCPGIVSSIASTYRRDPSGSSDLLKRLYQARVARKELYKENFEVIQTDRSYLNALRHDVLILSGDHFEKFLTAKKPLCPEHFLRKLTIYFSNENEIINHYQKFLMHVLETKPHVKLARIAALLGNIGSTPIWPISITTSSKTQKQVANALGHVTHLIRPYLIKETAKGDNLVTVANWIHTCSENSLRKNIPKLLLEPRHARLVLALRTPGWPGLISQTMLEATKSQPTKSLRVTIRVLKQHGDHFNKQDWDTFNSVLMTIDLKNKKQYLYSELSELNAISNSCRLDYSIIMYEVLEKIGLGSEKGPSFISVLSLLTYIYDYIDKVNVEYIRRIARQFLDNYYTTDKIGSDDFKYSLYASIFVQIIARFLLLNVTELQQKESYTDIGYPFLKKTLQAFNASKEKNKVLKILMLFVYSLKYTKSFLDPKSCLYALKPIENFFKESIPMEKSFGVNCQLRFTILYGDTLKKCVIEKPDYFQGGKFKNIESVQYAAVSFGKTVAIDIEELVVQYFQSVRNMYNKVLISFLKEKIVRPIPEKYFIPSFINGLVHDRSKINGVLAGVFIYHNFCFEKEVKEKLKEEIQSIANCSDEVKYFLNFKSN
ncbi:uncharacterized protein LOC131843856 [Achroia grisella]|uniref:uncharacterized protein LOC131843856 n=1 Tax=Achroia grisella TaxID=688607 RepID=UPI0027D34414|nr:uncharacterized protein LOC131843856 [Achroia grisella]